MVTETKKQTIPVNFELENNGRLEPHYLIQNIIECINFWKREGHYLIQQNKAGKMGSLHTQEQARKQAPQTFILECLLNDTATFCNSVNKQLENDIYLTGKGGGHVWVSKADTRIMIIRVKEFQV